jgi:3-hydroxybutyryl-CoA dehydratase
MSEAPTTLRTLHYHEINVGMKVAHDYVITPEVYAHFLAAFQDHSPVHVDEAFAKSRGFAGKVMHGSVLNGFISHFVGMRFPGRFSLLLSVDLRFANPSYLGDTIQLTSTVSQKMEAQKVVVLDVALTNTTRNCPAARGRIQVMLKEEA